MTMRFVDTHCHVDLYPSPETVVHTAAANGVEVIAVTNAPHVFHFTRELARRYPHLYPAVGLHPELVADYGHLLDELLEHLDQARFIGEVGLDYVTRDDRLRQRQRLVFKSVIERCARPDSVVSIHSRRAVADVLAIVGDGFPGSCILHWFSGSPSQLRRALDAGCYFSVNPAMVISERGRSLVAQIPRQRVLTESDGPFAKFNGRPATPADMLSVVEAIANIWGVPVEQAAGEIYGNFTGLLDNR